MISNNESKLIPSPKQNGNGTASLSNWYPYYAGYCPHFVRSVLELTDLPATGVVLDPWNGAGTTTRVACEMGFDTIGVDINPVMVIASKARLVDSDDASNLRDALATIRATALAFRSDFPSSDPLGAWFKERGLTAIRRLYRAVLTWAEMERTGIEPGHLADRTTPEAAFFLLAFFRVLRCHTQKFRASNPTWVEIPKDGRQKATTTTADLVSAYEREVEFLLDDLEAIPSYGNGVRRRVHTASSTDLPIQSAVADVVVTSPPYCTRIDYAVTTSVELALLGVDPRSQLRVLRSQMIGTTTVAKELPSPSPSWGPECNEFLTQLIGHSSKASRSYYYKTHLHYFDQIFRSLCEIDRCLRPGGQCIIVVQDSFYKDIRNDLPTAFSEMGHSIGWKLTERSDFPVTRSMLRVNNRSRGYRESDDANESVLWLAKDRECGNA